MSKINCPNFEDFSPCKCPLMKWETRKDEYSLNCDGISEKHINAIFKSTTPANFSFINIYLTPKMLATNSSIVVVPEDIFGSHRALRYIILGSHQNCSCYSRDHNIRLYPHPKVDPEAFRSSRNFLEMFIIHYSDLSELSFMFLKGFKNLKVLRIEGSINIRLLDFPLLPNLGEFTIKGCTGINELEIFPNLLKNNYPYQIGVTDSGLSNEAVDEILKCIFDLLSFADKSRLANIKFSGNALTRIPRALNTYFHDIYSIELSRQKYPGIKLISALDFPNAHLISILDLKASHIKHIKPNTLKCKKTHSKFLGST